MDCVNQFDEMLKFRGSLPKLLKKLTENLQENQNTDQIKIFMGVIQKFLGNSIFDLKTLFFSNKTELSAFYYIKDNDVLGIFLEKAFHLLKNSEDIINQVVLLIEKYLRFHHVDLDDAFMFLQNLVSRCERGGIPLLKLRDEYGFNLLMRMLLTEQTASENLAEIAIQKEIFPHEILSERTLTEFVVDPDLSKKKKQIILAVKWKDQEHMIAEQDLNFSFRRVPRYTSVLMVAGRISCWSLVGSILDLNPQKYPNLLTSKTDTIHPLFEKDNSGETIFYMAYENKKDSGDYNICEKLVTIVDEFTLTNAHIIGDETAIQYLYKSGPEPDSLIQMIENKCKKQRDEEECQDSPSSLVGKSCGYDFHSLDGKTWSCKSCNVTLTTGEDLLISEISHYLRYICINKIQIST